MTASRDFWHRWFSVARLKRGAPALLRVLVPLVLIGALWQIVDSSDAIARLGSAAWPWLAAGFVAANLQIIVSALRWKLVAGRLGLPIGATRSIGEYYLAQLVNQTMPGGVMGDAARAVRSRETSGLTRSAQAVVIERMAGQLALLAVFGGGVLVSLAVPRSIVWARVEGLGGVLLAVIVVIVLVLGIVLGPARRLRAVSGFGRAVRTALFSGWSWLAQAGLSLLIVALNLFSFAACAMATGTSMSLLELVTVVPMILVAMLVPITVAGWGFREGAAAGLFPLLGTTAAAGLAASLAFGVVILAASLPGIVWLLLARRQAMQTAPS